MSFNENLSICSLDDLPGYFVVPKDILTYEGSFSLKRLIILIYDGCSHSISLCKKNPSLESLYNSLGYGTVTFTEKYLSKCCNVSTRQLKRLISLLDSYGIMYSRHYSNYLEDFYIEFSFIDIERFSNDKLIVPNFIISDEISSSELFVYVVMFNNMLLNSSMRRYPAALCNYQYISNAFGGKVSTSTISKNISSLLSKKLIIRNCSLKRKNTVYSYLFKPFNSSLKNELFLPFSTLEHIREEQLTITNNLYDSLCDDISKISEDISESLLDLPEDKTENSGDIFDDKYILSKSLIKYRYNINTLSQLLQDKSNISYISRLTHSKDLISFKNKATYYTLKMGFDYKTSSRIAASFICEYIFYNIKLFNNRLNNPELYRKKYEESLYYNKLSRMKLELAYKLFLTCDKYLIYSSGITKTLNVIFNKIENCKHKLYNISLNVFDEEIDEMWYKIIMTNNVV